jgi:hypothetical protein
MPAPFACAASRTVPLGSSTCRHARFGPRSLVRIGRVAELRDRRADAVQQPLARELRADHSGRRDADLALLDPEQLRGDGLGGVRRLQPAPAVAGVGPAGVGDHCPQPPEVRLTRGGDGRADPRVGREPRRRHGLGDVGEQHADVQALGLQPRGHARRAEARRQQRGFELGRVRGLFDPA